MPAGSSRGERLDPFALPLSFAAVDHTADGHLRLVELYRERVVLRRDVRGIKMAVNLPVAAYVGVVIRIEPPTQDTAGAVTIVLEHTDPQLSLTLYRAADCSEIVAEWQAWGRALALPLLVADADGRLRDPFERLGRVRIGTPAARRRRRSALRARRPSFPLRRRPGSMPSAPIVHHGEHEIIARN